MNATVPANVLNVLLVEDSPTDVLLARESMEGQPQFFLTHVERLDDALKAMITGQFAVILLDLGLPDSQGLATLVKLHQKAAHIPVVVMTASDDEELAMRAVQAGAQDYLVKSQVQSGMLGRAIRYAIGRRQSEAALRDSEERFRNAFESTNVPMVLTDLDNRFVRANGAFARMFGYSPSEILTMSMADITHPDDLAESYDRRVELLARQLPYFQVEKRYLHKDGRVLWGLTNISLIRDAAGRPQQYVGQVQDITERKRAEAERDALLARLRLHIERMPLAYVQFDAALRVIDWNPSAERTFGYSKEEVLGIGPPFEKIVPASFQGQVEPLLARIRAGDLAAHSVNENLTKDRRTITCEWYNTPLLDEHGRFGGLLCLARDITERKRLEDQFRQAQERLQHVVVSSPAVLFTLAVEGEQIRGISWISDNLRAMLGYAPEDAFHPDWWLTNIHPEDRELLIGQTPEQLFGQGHTVHEYRFRHGDGTYRWTLGEMRLIRDPAGRPVEAVGSWSDITERKQLEEQLRQAQKMEAVGQLAGGVAHDFNNLLTIINGYSDILQSELPTDSPMQALVREIGQAGERAAALTRQLLAFSRKQVLEPKVLDLNAVVADTERMLRRLIGEDVAVSAVLDPALGRVKADPGQIEQVLMNLAVNARDAMPQGGRLTIETANVGTGRDVRAGLPRPAGRAVRRAGGHRHRQRHDRRGEGAHLRAVLHDQGAGQGHGAGAGDGLRDRQAERRARRRRTASWGAGRRSRSTCRRSRNRSRRASRTPACKLARRGTETVLLVEDEPALRALARHVLQTHGYTVLEAGDGEEALRVAGEHRGRSTCW